jgi:hypothetical protein
MKHFFLLLITLAILSGCTSSNDFETGAKQLKQQGYTDIEMTGHKFFCCSDDESFSTGFKAKNSEGEIVTGCFCSELFKGVTIRFE